MTLIESIASAPPDDEALRVRARGRLRGRRAPARRHAEAHTRLIGAGRARGAALARGRGS